ncbi:MAG: glycosyltransferase [Blautia sp.]|nr:glycosyltransferase [Blautia sp.]MCM1200177.1 glycosyltransferase [Bacteroides fragilis]
MLPISVCIIAKNEEKHIAECLKRLKPFHYEIVLVDTGSTDGTLKIAADYTDRIYHFTWIDDFSAARNFAADRASNDWILSIDCDEYLESIDENELSELMRQHPEETGRILLRNRFEQGGLTSFENVRLCRLFNRKSYCFTGAIHEQVTQKDASPDIVRAFAAPITVLHVGYDGSEEEMQAKSRRNITLLEQELASAGPDAYLYYQLGQSCMRLKDYDKACEWFDLGLSMDIDPAQDYVQNMVESYGYCLLDRKRPAEALRLENIYDIFAVRADFVFLMGLIYMNNGLFTEAIAEFQKSTTMKQFSVEGINSYRARYNIGVIYECTGHPKEAQKYYRMCGNFEPARKRLEEMR